MAKPPPIGTDEKLDAILHHVGRMDRRDRLRTIAGFFKGILTIIPIIILLGSVWYFYNNGDQLIAKVAEESAKQAATFMEKGSSNLLKGLDIYLPK